MDIIVGAGVSGISYARFTKNEYKILEKENEIGGYCRTIKKDGFVWDYSGHFFHFQNPEIERIVCQSMAPDTLVDVEKHTQIIYKNAYIDFPFQKNIHQLEKEEFIDCLYDLFFAEEADYANNSFKGMVYNKLGRSIAEKFLIPYNEKLYACDLNTLDPDAMGRFFPKANKEDIVRNFRNSSNESYNSTFRYPKGGAIDYINSLSEPIPSNNIVLDEEIIAIDIDKQIAFTKTSSYQYDNLISTIPLPRLLDIAKIDYDRSIFTYNKVLVYNLGFDSKGKDKINSWVYIPSKDFIFYRVGYYDNIVSNDRMSLYVEIGFPSEALIEDSECLLDRVLCDLRKIGILSNDQTLVSYSSVLMNPAYVHINTQSVEYVKKYKELLAQKNIYSIGRYGSWTYCSIEDNIIESKELAEKLNHHK